jgi:hypothetical protein
MALASVTEQNQALATTGWGFISIHSATPGTTGASEITGGSPAYARVAVTWNAASGGAVTNSNALTFNLPSSASAPNNTAAYFGIWSASTAGTYYIGGALNGGTPIVNGATQGTLTIAAGALSITAA